MANRAVLRVVDARSCMLHPTLTSRIAHSQVFGISIFVSRTFAHARLQELRKGGEGSMINDEVPLAADKRLLGNSDSRGSPMLTESLEMMGMPLQNY